MSSLIDAEVLIRRLKKWDTNNPTDKALYNFAMNRTIEQPIAYDVEAVVKKLEEMANKPVELVYDVPLINSIIDIVRRGGVK